MNRETKGRALAKLEEMYPEAKAELVFSNPYEMMVATILSAQCTDRQVNKVTPAVFARYPDASAMADALEEDLYPMVKSCGFKTKAANIIAACRMIRDEQGGYGGGNGKADDPADSEGEMGERTSLADMARAQDMQSTTSAV